MASLQHDLDYDHLPTIQPSPTRGQILALGYLMICKHVYLMPGISQEDIQELIAMRLCHAAGYLLRYNISSRLLREWAPYHRYAVEWNRCYELLRSAPPPAFTATKDGLTFRFPEIVAFMDTLVLECGRSLAVKWRAWKMEDGRDK